MKNTHFFSGLAIGALLISSCEKAGNTGLNYSVPSTYNFQNVNYSGQTARLDMLDEMGAYMESARVAGTVLNAQTIKDMFSNANAPFADAALNTSGKQLKNKCFAPDVAMFEAYMDSIALASTASTPGGNGVAGIVTSTGNPSKKYVLSANGWDYTEMIKKGLMGGVFYYQAINTYLENLMLDDNTVVTPGEGTVMQHHFDEAFGYFGVPVDFPVNTVDARFWGKYCNTVDVVLNSNTDMMNSWISGRYFIGKNNYSLMGSAVAEIRTKWDVIIAASAIHEINGAIAGFSDDAVRNHLLSEFVAFVASLKYSPYAQITGSEISTILGFIGNDLYEVTLSDLNQAKDMLSTIYGLDSVKNQL